MSQPTAPIPAPNEPTDDEAVDSLAQSRFLMLAMPSWLVSGCIHFVMLILLALLTIAPPHVSAKLHLSASPPRDVEVVVFKEDKIELKLDSNEPFSTIPIPFAAPAADSPSEVDIPSVPDDLAAAPPELEIRDFGEEVAPRGNTTDTIGTITGDAFIGRTEIGRKALAAKGGATEASESAVAAALEWLANHQLPDGGWNYDHRAGACNARCGNAGSLTDCRTGATAQALLPFLGAGQTHKQGKYKKQVEAGLYFLTQQMIVRPNGGLQTGDLAQGGGNMYAHGMSAIVLCEAYGMTHDKGLMMPAQLSLNHIVYAQDPVGGGWRYAPRTPGDTSVVGWQLMALKSGHLAYLQVPPATINGANKFLDSVMSDYSFYGYTDPGRGQATTAIGILCRMYLGWKKDHPGIEKGVQYLSQTGPSQGNMYYNYYATQCMRHYDGELWDKWNVKMRDQLVNSQDKTGHLKGSWHMKGDHGSDRGGRLYCTSMATMILEVYYRHMPIYGQQAAQDDFPVK